MKNSKTLLKLTSITLASATLLNSSFASASTDVKPKKSSIIPKVVAGVLGFSATAGLAGGLIYKSIDAKKKSEKLKELETENKKLKVKSEKSDEYDSLKKQFDDVEAQRKKLEADLREAKTSTSDEYEKLKKQFEQLKSKRKDLEEKLKKFDTENPIHTVPQKSTTKSKKISDLEERRQKLEKELQQAEVNVRTLSARYDDATKIIEKLRKEKPDIDRLLQQQREEFRETIQSLGSHSQGSLKTYKIYILSAISSDFVELVKYPSKDIKPFCDEFKGYMPGKRIEISDIYNILEYFNNFMIADKGFVQLLNSKDHFRQYPIPEDKYERFLYCLANILKKLDDTYEYRDPMDKFYFFKSCEVRDIMRYSEIEKYLLPKSGLDKT